MASPIVIVNGVRQQLGPLGTLNVNTIRNLQTTNVDIGAADDLILGGRGITITLNQVGNVSLTGFTATSLIGALNELKASVNALPGDALPTALDATAGAIGTSPQFAHEDHDHQILVGSPVTIGTANADGNAATLSRSNHVHAHGDQPGGTLHALVTTSTAGFMSAADKAKIDNVTAFTLDAIINATARDNDVNIPSANPLIFRDSAGNFDVVSIHRTGTGAGQALNITTTGSEAAILATTNSDTKEVIRWSNAGETRGMFVRPDRIQSFGGNILVIGATNASGTGYQTTIEGGWTGGAFAGGDVSVLSGSSASTSMTVTGNASILTATPPAGGNTATGSITLKTGNPTGTGNVGSISIYTGTPVTGTKGGVSIEASAGDTPTVVDGEIRLKADVDISFSARGAASLDFNEAAHLVLSGFSATSLIGALNELMNEKADKTITLTAGNGLTGGGTLSANRTFDLGTPGSTTNTSTNAATADSHTHLLETYDGVTRTLTTAITSYPNNQISGSLADATFPAGIGPLITMRGGSDNRVMQLYSPANGGTQIPDVYIRTSHTTNGTGGWTSLYKLWHSGNDGDGSGLDADTLDGQHNSYFINTSATAQTKTGDLTVANFIATGGNIYSRAQAAGNAHFWLRDDIGVNQGVLYWNRTDDTVRLRRYNTVGDAGEGEISITGTEVSFNSNPLWHSGNNAVGTYLGKTGNVGTDSATNTAALWSALPVGYSRMLNQSIGTGGGLPEAGYGYFTKIANRDNSGGWGGLWTSYTTTGKTYIGRTVDSTTFATWDQIWTAATDGAGSGLDADTVDGVQLTGIGESVTLQQVLTSGTIDNDVSVLNTSPVVLRDGGVSFTPLSVVSSVATGNSSALFKTQQGDHYISFHAQLSSSGYNPIVQANDKALIFTEGTQGTGGFVIAPWSTSRSGLRISTSDTEIDSPNDIILKARGATSLTLNDSSNLTLSGFTATSLVGALNELKGAWSGSATGTKGIIHARFSTTANLNLATTGLTAHNGITPVDGDIVLVRAQTAAAENGIYRAHAGAWTRHEELNTSAKVVSGMLVSVSEGTSNSDTVWMLTTNAPITLGTTALSFSILGDRITLESVMNSGMIDNDITLNTESRRLILRATGDYTTGNALLSLVRTNTGAGRGLIVSGTGTELLSSMSHAGTAGNVLYVQQTNVANTDAAVYIDVASATNGGVVIRNSALTSQYGKYSPSAIYFAGANSNINAGTSASAIGYDLTVRSGDGANTFGGGTLYLEAGYSTNTPSEGRKLGNVIIGAMDTSSVPYGATPGAGVVEVASDNMTFLHSRLGPVYLQGGGVGGGTISVDASTATGGHVSFYSGTNGAPAVAGGVAISAHATPATPVNEEINIKSTLDTKFYARGSNAIPVNDATYVNLPAGINSIMHGLTTGSSLQAVLTTGIIDNDVTLTSTQRVLLRDGGTAFTSNTPILDLIRTSTGLGSALNISTAGTDESVRINHTGTAGNAIWINHDPADAAIWLDLNGPAATGIVLASTAANADLMVITPTSIGMNTRATAGAAYDISLYGGATTVAGTNGGHVKIYGGAAGTGGVAGGVAISAHATPATPVAGQVILKGNVGGDTPTVLLYGHSDTNISIDSGSGFDYLLFKHNNVKRQEFKSTGDGLLIQNYDSDGTTIKNSIRMNATTSGGNAFAFKSLGSVDIPLNDINNVNLSVGSPESLVASIVGACNHVAASTSASTVSTIVRRDASGDISARLFRSEYDTTNSSIGYIMTQVDTVNNNYLRPSTPTQVQAGLGLDAWQGYCTLTAITSCTINSTYLSQGLRVAKDGSAAIISLAGRAYINVTATGWVVFAITPPWPSNFTLVDNAAGTVGSEQATIATGHCWTEHTGDKIRVTFYVTATGTYGLYYILNYSDQ